MNVAVVQIGGYLFGFKKTSDAAKVVQLLSSAICLDSEWDDATRKLMFEVIEPGSEKDLNKLSMLMVSASQIRAPIKRAPKNRQLGFTDPIG